MDKETTTSQSIMKRYTMRRVRVEIDESPQNPRVDFDNLGSIKLLDRHDSIPMGKNDGFIGEQIVALPNKNDFVSLLLCRMGNYLFAFDKGTSERFIAGYITVSRKDVNDQFSAFEMLSDEEIKDILRGEIETFNSYINGDVYGFIHEEQDVIEMDGKTYATEWGEINAVWGFYGHNHEKNGIADYYFGGEAEIVAQLKANDGAFVGDPIRSNGDE